LYELFFFEANAKFNRMQTVYITGIAGFIGFHLARKLKNLGFFVLGCDDFNPAYNVELKRQRAAILEEENIPVHPICISNKEGQRALFKKHPPHFVIHLAAQAGVRASIEQPDIFIKTNVQGFIDLLEVVKDFKAKFLYASSSSVYGDNKEYPSSEAHKTDSPLSLYGATKKSNELMAFAYHKIYNIPMIGLRFFTCYGPYGRPDMAIYLFTDKIFHQRPITVYGEGKMERDFTYVDDIVQGILAAMAFETPFDIFNLGKGKTDNLLHLISIIETRLNKKAIIDFQPRPEVDPIKNCADVSKAQGLLGYTPSTPLEIGVNRFIDWYLK
jgi:UDP-glucuronate 4-epimerase